ncbi:MAG: hypothetical protein OES38_17100, partial [Gammaproteobacteria bacterium]|nr:hypothetical protein [Gammaproteobacteria bacterium]
MIYHGQFARLLWLLVGTCAQVTMADVAIVGGTLYTMETDTPLQGATLLIEDGVVEAVGANLEIPPGYERIDAAGKFVTPGLIESHSQLGLE